MRELDKISASLFDKIRARFDHVSIGDEKAQSVTDPETARCPSRAGHVRCRAQAGPTRA